MGLRAVSADGVTGRLVARAAPSAPQLEGRRRGGKSTRGGVIERRSVPAPGLRSDEADQLERSLAALPGVLAARADADRAEIVLEVDPAVVSDEEIAAAMGNAGLDASA